MTRKGLFTAMMAGSALLAAAPAQATQNFGLVGGIVNQLYYGSSLSGNGFTFTIIQNGKPVQLFTGLSGLRQYNDLAGFNSWANPGGGGAGGYNYTPTFNGVGSYFGNGGGNAAPQSYNYSPTFTGVGSYFPTNAPKTGPGYNYTPTYTGVGAYFSNGGGVATPQFASELPIPEPGTWAMMIFGFFAVGAAMRRRKSTTNFA